MDRRLIIVTEYFYPAQRNDAFLLTKIVKKFSENNDISVLCTTELKGKTELKFVKDKIFRISSLNINSTNIFFRIMKLIIVSFKLVFKSLLYLKKNDRVFIVTNPAFMLPLLILIKKIKKFELTVLVYDVFPDNLIATKILKEKSLFFKLLKKTFNWAYLNSDQLVVIGRDMKDIMEMKTKNNVPVVLIENWCDYLDVFPAKKEENSIIQNYELEKKIVFSFVGNFGLVQGIETLLTASKLVKNKNFVLLFIGSGSETKKIENFINKNLSKNVIYAGKYSNKDKNIFLNACDISLISLDESMYGLGVPSKSYYNMAAKKPLLYVGHKNSEIAQLVREYQIGWTCESSNPKELAKVIDKICDEKEVFSLIGEKSRKTLIENFSEEIILKKYEKLYPGKTV